MPDWTSRPMRIVLAHGTDGFAPRSDRPRAAGPLRLPLPPPGGRPCGPRAAMTGHDPTGIFGTSTALHDILVLAGPETAPRLLQQIHADLVAVASLLLPALPPPHDWPQIRRQTHVLISLAGTIGAMRLHGLAIEMNTAAHDQDSSRAAALLPPLEADLTRLIALVGLRLPGHGVVA